mgnify:FL=1|tara:strand:+ start:19631 stop:19810 length:180 start_codon:yes stop_codon:yes gene_type:complete
MKNEQKAENLEVLYRDLRKIEVLCGINSPQANSMRETIEISAANLAIKKENEQKDRNSS